MSSRSHAVMLCVPTKSALAAFHGLAEEVCFLLHFTLLYWGQTKNIVNPRSQILGFRIYYQKYTKKKPKSQIIFQITREICRTNYLEENSKPTPTARQWTHSLCYSDNHQPTVANARHKIRPATSWGQQQHNIPPE